MKNNRVFGEHTPPYKKKEANITFDVTLFFSVSVGTIGFEPMTSSM